MLIVRLSFRTTRINEAIIVLCLIDNKLGGKKNGTNLNNLDLSQKVIPLG